MHVVFVVAGQVLGGAERGAIDLAHELGERHGARVSICALDDRPGPGRLLAEERGIPWRSARVRWERGPVSRSRALARFAGLARDLRPDVLVACTNGPNVFTGLSWRRTGARLAVWTQCDVNGSARFHPRVMRRAIRSTPVVLSRAQHAVEWLVRTWDADRDRIRVLRSPLLLPAPGETRGWHDRLSLGSETFVGCMVAHFHAGKDHATVIRAWRTVADALGSEGSSIPVLVLAGRDAGTRERAERLVDDLELADHVRFVGEVEDVSGLLKAADVALFASRRELLPRGVLEPMAAGLPVAATEDQGTREAMGDPGRELIVPAGGAARLGAVVVRLASDPRGRERIGRANARLIGARHSREATSDAFAMLVSDALASRR